MHRKLVMRLASALLVLPLLAAPVYAAGGGGGGGGGGGNGGGSGGGSGGGDGGGSPTIMQCRKGQVWDARRQRCVIPKRRQLDDNSIYDAGRELALAGRYGEAIAVLSLASEKSDPRILNYLGYSHRMQGRVLVGLGYYEEALRVNPDYTLAREYLGEAHLQLGDVKAAREQLTEIEKRCGKECKEYVELADRIAAFDRRG